MPFLCKQVVTARNVNGDSVTHQEGSVLSDWELEPYARQKILEGSEWYRARFEPLTDREAHGYRVRATQAEQPHVVDGALVLPPFDDYVGLHPTEIVARLKSGSVALTQHARRYEAGGMRRDMIVSFVHPAERQPFLGYDDMDLRGILEKLEILPDDQVAEAKVYEANHQERPAIVEFERESVPA
jgi:hypothetical protein